MLAPALLPRRTLDIGELEELAPDMGEAAGFNHGGKKPAGPVKLVVASIGVGLQKPRPGGEMGARMLDTAIAGIIEQCGRR